MSYSHITTNSHNPTLDFWRSLEILIAAFPYRQGIASFISKSEFITYYETKFNERFDTDYNESDVYGKPLTREFIWSGSQRTYLDQIGSMQKMNIEPSKIQRTFNDLGRIIKFLNTSISNEAKVRKFQHFIEAVYYYLVDIHNLNPDLAIIRQHGLDNQDHGQFQIRLERFNNRDGGLMDTNSFSNRFNDICLTHKVPFMMVVFKDQCFVIHTTDKFIEKIIQNIPLFITHPDLEPANQLFINSYVSKTEGDHQGCLAKAREGLDSVRDYIFNHYGLTPSNSVHNDMKQLFNSHSSVVFDYTKIPEDDSGKLAKIVEYLRDSILLAVKMGNFGHHPISRSQLLDENISNFTLGLIASIIPYLVFLLR